MRLDTPGTPPRFDEYLSKIESMEKARRRKRFLMILPVVVIIGTGVWFFNSSSDEVRGNSNIVMASNSQQAAIIKADNSEFLDIEPTFHPVNQEEEEAAETTALPQQEAETQEAIWFSVDVSGLRQVRERLVYKIENYQEGFSYTIDFGNGVVKKMEESISYRYPLPGHFDMKLTATSPEGEVVEYVKKYEILPAISTSTAQVSQP